MYRLGFICKELILRRRKDDKQCNYNKSSSGTNLCRHEDESIPPNRFKDSKQCYHQLRKSSEKGRHSFGSVNFKLRIYLAKLSLVVGVCIVAFVIAKEVYKNAVNRICPKELVYQTEVRQSRVVFTQFTQWTNNSSTQALMKIFPFEKGHLTLQKPNLGYCSHSVPEIEFDVKIDGYKSKRENNLNTRSRSYSWAEEVREAALHTWNSYSKAAWGRDMLKPLSNTSENSMGLGLTLIESMSTLWLMRFYDEFDKAALWVETEFKKFDNCRGFESFFEITIRVLGGLLSAYSLSGRPGLFDTIKDLGSRYLAIFQGKTLVPQKINLCTQSGVWDQFATWIPISEISTFQMEFRMLTFLTGDRRYLDIANAASTNIVNASFLQPSGFRYLPRSHIALFGEAKFRLGEKLTLGAFMDSYIEYLLKVWIQTDRTEHEWRALWHGAMDETFSQLVDTTLGMHHFTYINTALNYKRTPPVNLLEANSTTFAKLYNNRYPLSWYIKQFKTYITSRSRSFVSQNGFMQWFHARSTERKQGGHRPKNSMEHLACFAPAMLIMAARNLRNESRNSPNSCIEHNNPVTYASCRQKHHGASDAWEYTAEEITRTCVSMYSNSETGLGPEIVEFNMTAGSERELFYNVGNDHYLLRPELMESLYYMYYYTGNPKYQYWGYEIFRNIQKHCKTSSGYASILHVTSKHAEKMDIMESFWISETLKYLFLLFSPRSILNMTDWVFNTEAHPLPVLKGGLPPELRSAHYSLPFLHVVQPYFEK